MILPRAERAFVDPKKLQGYLLSPDHPKGGNKARAFAAMGYSKQHWHSFARQLRLLAATGLAQDAGSTPYGKKYKVDGILRNPIGATFAIRTIWIVRGGEQVPRLVTAYPRRP